MKKQSFGIEIEGNNITREKAAKTAAEYLGTGRYEYTARRNGYESWSAWAGMEVPEGCVHCRTGQPETLVYSRAVFTMTLAEGFWCSD